jgi:hypothetical protein
MYKPFRKKEPIKLHNFFTAFGVYIGVQRFCKGRKIKRHDKE